ncbi:membrane fusion protein (multidrug efflux system) [Fluviicoccus keumensis]|uniref:Membrane fusion protein (Multidrug efflux system) n=1 Tax=Fluviicoccus keumensis TaxID=1435465 RepID=A0A4Q7YHX0_9GAMM|nr:HlyD family efflux transporter periplasmic adaptor subunit [Fluviicoccus keumensis]RZU36780.1 membrane fusion protein (multidrug efflux system) [Fluviicoccus keumensis]
MTDTQLDTGSPQQQRKRRWVLIGITALFLIGSALYAVYAALVLSKREYTDNAYVGGNVVTLTAQVTGNVVAISADETQQVQAGAELIKLDPVDAEVALAQAEAKLGSVVRQLREQYTGLSQYEATVVLRRKELIRAQDDFARRQPLAADQTLPLEEVAHAQQTVQTAESALSVAEKQLETARAGLQGVTIEQHPNVLAAKADFIQAWIAARRNAVLAPVSGYIGKRSVQVGTHVVPGTALMTIIPVDQLWVDANFKESELRNIRVGQPVTLEADAYGGKIEYHGKVLGLSPGTGSAFSLLPAQNATGNWIKVVQRVPVRIALDPQELRAHPLRVGLSMLATADTHDTSGQMLGAPAPANPAYITQAPTVPMKQADEAARSIIAKQLAKG